MSIEKLREMGCKVEKVAEDSDVYLVSKGNASVYATEQSIKVVGARILSTLEDEWPPGDLWDEEIVDGCV